MFVSRGRKQMAENGSRRRELSEKTLKNKETELSYMTCVRRVDCMMRDVFLSGIDVDSGMKNGYNKPYVIAEKVGIYAENPCREQEEA